MNKHIREEHHEKTPSRRIENKTQDEYAHINGHDLDSIMNKTKECPDTDTSKHEKEGEKHKDYGHNKNKAEPFTETKYLKKGGHCEKKMHMAAGGAGKIRHDQYY